MKIGILGTGEVGKAIAKGFIALGHEVKMGAREAGNPKAQAWAKEAGAKASAGTFADAAAFGEVVVLATLGAANKSALEQAGPDKLKGKLVIDTTNPLDFSKGMPPGLLVSGNDSGGEQVQRQLPGAKVVKAFNIVGNTLMFRPELPGGPPDMLIAGNDEGAKKKTAEILEDFGWPTVDLGGIEASRYLEAMCIVWVLYGARTGGWNHAFKMLRK
jgi:8-hydroxy-5-deazaflavin:NADPH oxidoreductase